MNVGISRGISIARPIHLSKPGEKPHPPVVIVVPTGPPVKEPSPRAIRKVRGGTAGALIGASLGLYGSTMLLSGLPGLVVGLTLGGLVLGAAIGTAAS